MKLFTIILTNYNQEKYIYEAINSIALQEYNNIELIITDDCSKYFPLDDIKKYINKKSHNIKELNFIINEENIGTVKTINKALNMAHGEYVIIFAADDALYDKNVLNNLALELQNNDIITSQAYMCSNKLKVDELAYKFVNEDNMGFFNKLSSKKQFYYIANECPFVSGATAYNKKVFDNVGYFDEEYKLVEDWPFWLKLTSHGEKIRFINNVSLLHRDGGISHSNFKEIPKNIEIYYRDIIKVYTNYIIPSLKKAPKKYKYLIIDKYMFYICKYDEYIPGLYNEYLDSTNLAWKYTNYQKYFNKMQKKKKKEGIE